MNDLAAQHGRAGRACKGVLVVRLRSAIGEHGERAYALLVDDVADQGRGCVKRLGEGTRQFREQHIATRARSRRRELEQSVECVGP